MFAHILRAAACLLAMHLLAAGNAQAQQPRESTEAAKQDAPAQPKLDRYGDPIPAGAVLRLGTTRWRHNGHSPELVFSRDGKTLFSSNSNWEHYVCCWDCATGKELRKVVEEKGVQTIAISPDERLLATGSFDGVRLWELSTGKEVRALSLRSVRSLAFSADGTKIISGHGDRAVRVVDVKTGKELVRHSWHKTEVDWVGCTPDGATLISASTMNGGICWANMATGELERRVEVRGARYYVFAVSADRQWAGLGGSSREKTGKSQQWLALYDLNTGDEVLRLDTGGHYVEALAFAPDGKTLVSLGHDQTLRFWSVSTGRELRKLPFLSKVGRKVLRFSPDGKTLAAMVGDAVIRLWDLEKGKERHTYIGHEGEINSIAFSPDGESLASSAWDDTVARVWNLRTGNQTRALSHSKYLRAVAFLPDGKTLATSGGDGHLRLWDAAKGVEARILATEGKQQAVSMTLCSDGKTLITSTAGFDGEDDVRYRTATWDIPTGKRLFQREDKRSFGQFPTVSPDGKLIATVAPGGIVLRDIVTGDEVLTIKPSEKYRFGFRCFFSPDSTLLAVPSSQLRMVAGRGFSDNPSVRVYDTAGHELHEFPNSTAIGPAAFSPDGKRLAIAGRGDIQLYELTSGRLVRRIDDCGASVHALAISPDGKRLAAGLEDTTVLVWDLGR